MPIKDKLEPFSEGDENRTAFSAETMNELIDAINAFLGLRGTGGIRVIKADAGFVIDGRHVSGSGTGGGGGTTSSYSGSNIVYNCSARYV